MDYQIGFAIDDAINMAAFLSQLAAENPEIVAEANGVRVGQDMRVAPVSGAEHTVTTTGATPTAMHILLRAYFSSTVAPDAGVVIFPVGASEMRMVAITREDDTAFGDHAAGTTLSEQDILSSRAVFESVWPDLWTEVDTQDQADPDIETIQEPSADGLVLSSLLQDPEETRDEVSWLVFEAPPQDVISKLLAAPKYDKLDDDFYQIDLPDIDAAIYVVAFATEEGPSVEIRVPLAARQIDDAMQLLALRNVTAKLALHYVTEVDDASEEFLIQDVQDGGRLGTPRRVKLVF